MTRYEIHIVVLSNIPKDLGPDVEVIVGLPTRNPWSLPFGHKQLFADCMQQYDLFIYSEDDTLITERNIDAFLQVTNILPDKYIAGFIRYEISESGKKYYTTIHSHYHWVPKSVLKIGEYIFAQYTNDHSACFILTKTQLKKAIDSGGFLLPARKGRYDMLCTAATDPYTQCGMKKLICISHLNNFCLHHLPDAYRGRIGLYSEWADREIEKLKKLSENEKIRGPLFETNTLLDDATFDKKYYEPCRKDILSLIPSNVRRMLSVGCASGSTESKLVEQGIEVVGIPLDCVIQVSAEASRIQLLPASFEAAREDLVGRKFDCILFQDVLHHLPDPVSIVREFSKLIGNNGTMVISVPNFNHPSVIRNRMLWKIRFPKINDTYAFEKYKLHVTTRRLLKSWLHRCGLKVVRLCRNVGPRYELINRFTKGRLNGVLSKNIVLLAKRKM